MSEELYFNQFFNIKTEEKDLEFINIPLDTDIKLYIDPYVISKTPGMWYVEANNLIVDYFEKLLSTIKDKKEIESLKLLDKLREPNETHFGLSEEKPDGCGIGMEQSMLLLKKLRNSKAIKTGYLSDLSDCELLIPGIGADKISDITTNIIREKLIEFTEEQAKRHNIPVKSVISGYFWSSPENKWTKRIANLPHYNNKPILLVPSKIAKSRTVSDYRDYYNTGILEYLQDMHLSMNTHLVKVLKNGKRKVTKKDLRKKYPCTKDFILEFSEEHTEVLRKYKNSRI